MFSEGQMTGIVCIKDPFQPPFFTFQPPIFPPPEPPMPPPTTPPPVNGGVVYTRWGRTTCPPTPGTQLVYSGRAAGGYYRYGSDVLCMPDDPRYSKYAPGVQGYGMVYGMEYHSEPNQPLHHVLYHNMPCAVCCGNRSKVLMVPAKRLCPPGWKREYYGYLMAPNYHDASFFCVDHWPESVPGQNEFGGKAHAVHVEAHCNGLDCSHYDPEKELTCVVCTN